MKFSIKFQYGAGALLALALNYEKKPLKIEKISKDRKIPIRYLEQLLLVLKRSGVVESVRGKKGGYILLKKPIDITMLDVVEVFEGAIEFCACNYKVRRNNVVCNVLVEAEDCVKEKLSSITLDDILTRESKKKELYTYNI